MNTATQREEELFDEARRLNNPAARREFLDRTCAGEAALRARIDGLLEATLEAERFFTESGTALTLPPVPLTSTRGTATREAEQISHLRTFAEPALACGRHWIRSVLSWDRCWRF